MMEKKRTYIAIDLKSFYASVECKERNRDPVSYTHLDVYKRQSIYGRYKTLRFDFKQCKKICDRYFVCERSWILCQCCSRKLHGEIF